MKGLFYIIVFVGMVSWCEYEGVLLGDVLNASLLLYIAYLIDRQAQPGAE